MNRITSRLWLFSIIILGALLRLVHLFYFRHSPFFSTPIVDELYHHLWAGAIARGHLLPNAVFFRAPLYPYFLGGLYAIFPENLLVPRIIQHLMGIAGIYLTYAVTLKLFRNRVMALIAGLLCAIYPTFILFECRLLLDSMALFWNLLFIYTFFIALNKNKIFMFLISGIILGFSALTRPNILITVPFILLWWIFYSKPVSIVLKPALIFLWGLGLIILPVTYLNYRAEKDLVLISSQAGINFYIGNNPKSDGFSAVVPELGYRWDYKECEFRAEKESGRELKPSQISSFFFNRGLDFIKNEPGQATLLFLKKVYIFLNHYEIGNNGSLEFISSYSPLLKPYIGYWLICPLGLLGMILAIKNRGALLLTLIFISYSISVVIFFVIARFRIPVVPILIIFSSYSLIQLFELFKNQRWKKLLLILLILALLSLMVNLNILDFRSSNRAYSHFQLGNIFLRNGNLHDAQQEYELALVLYPALPDARLNLGGIYFKEGLYGKADSLFMEELKYNPGNAEALSNLGVLARLRGDSTKAIEWGEKAIDARESFPEGYLNLAISCNNFKDHERAFELIRSGLEISPEDKRLWLTGGAIAQKTGDFKTALKLYLTGLKKPFKTFVRSYDMGNIFEEQSQIAAPDSILNSYFHYNIGSILGKQEKFEDAFNHLSRALALNPFFLDAHLQMGTTLDRLGRYQEAFEHFNYAFERGYDSPELHFNIGIILAKMGRFDEASSELEIALKQSSDFKMAQDELEKIQQLKDPE
ncbi:tetratricopeptide repeat protein [bacterium]|nr:tetratricopeptide repeat protein [bacterium]